MRHSRNTLAPVPGREADGQRPGSMRHSGNTRAPVPVRYPFPTTTFGSMEGRYIPMPPPLAPAPLRRFQDWVGLSRPNELDKPTVQEYTLLVGAVLLTPIIIAFASIWTFFQPEFLKYSPGKRLLFASVIPFLLPAAYCYVVCADFLWPLVKRAWLRERTLRNGERAVRELMRSLP